MTEPRHNDEDRRQIEELAARAEKLVDRRTMISQTVSRVALAFPVLVSLNLAPATWARGMDSSHPVPPIGTGGGGGSGGGSGGSGGGSGGSGGGLRRTKR